MKNTDKLLDTLHSIFIRLKYTNENGNGNCFTCGKPLTYKAAECGHYLRRGNMAVRWSEDDCRIQCNDCNCFKDGLAEPFRDRLVSELGFEKVTRMEINARKPFKYSRWDKEQLVKTRRNQIRELLKDKNFIINIP